MSEKNNKCFELKCRVEKIETELNNIYCEIGKATLEIAEVEGKKVNRLVDEIISIKQELKNIQEK